METREMSQKCCSGMGGKHKKVLLVIGLISFAIAVTIVGAIGIHREEYGKLNADGQHSYGYNNQGRMMGRDNIVYPVPISIDDKNQFVIPQDAAKSGELAIAVDNLEVARKSVTDIAVKNEGSVYATFISYTSNDIKNGSIVVQVPADKFDSTFAALRSVGLQVVQESTQQIAPRNIYPMMQPASINNSGDAAIAPQEQSAPAPKQAGTKKTSAVVSATDANVSTVAPALAIRLPQLSQDKGYIRIVFAYYGAGKNIGATNIPTAGNIMYPQYAGQGNSKILWIGFGIKLLLLIVLIGLLGFIFKKIIHNLRRNKAVHAKSQTRLSEKRSVAAVVRQAPRSRIINTKKK